MNERRRQDLNIREAGIAALTSIYVNAHKVEGKPDVTPSDFMLFAPPKPKSSGAAMAMFNAHREARKARLAKAGHKVTS